MIPNSFCLHRTEKERIMFNHSQLKSETSRLQKFALRLTRNNADADDLLQSTCLRALEKADTFETGTNLFSWTSKIMYNLFVSSYRRRVKFEVQYDPEHYIDSQYMLPVQDIQLELAEVDKAISKLRSEHREVLISVCVMGLSYEEVSTLLGIPVGTVRSRLSRARENLNEIMISSHKNHKIPHKLRAKENSRNWSAVFIYLNG